MGFFYNIYWHSKGEVFSNYALVLDCCCPTAKDEIGFDLPHENSVKVEVVSG